MSAVAFDTLKLARKLRESAQMSQEQAEGVSDALAEAMSGAELATKSDIRELAAATKSDIRELAAATKNDIRELAAAAKNDIRELELRLDARFEAIEGRFGAIDGRFGVMDGRFVALDGRFGALDGRFGALDGRFVALEERIERRAAESDSRMIRYVVGVGATAILTIVGAAWTIIRYLPPLPHG